LKIKLCK